MTKTPFENNEDDSLLKPNSREWSLHIAKVGRLYEQMGPEQRRPGYACHTQRDYCVSEERWNNQKVSSSFTGPVSIWRSEGAPMCEMMGTSSIARGVSKEDGRAPQDEMSG